MNIRHLILVVFGLLLVAFTTVECQLTYVKAITGPTITNGWDGDLGVPFWSGDRLYFLEGDILHQNHARIPNAIGHCQGVDPSNCNVNWNEVAGGWPDPFYNLSGQSTVPSGGIAINGKNYVFMMNVVNWGNGMPGNVLANSFGIVSAPPTPFSPTSVKYGDNSKFVNIAPTMSPDGSWVYLFGSGTYRASPIYVARVRPNDIANINAIQYYSSGRDTGSPCLVIKLC